MGGGGGGGGGVEGAGDYAGFKGMGMSEFGQKSKLARVVRPVSLSYSGTWI